MLFAYVVNNNVAFYIQRVKKGLLKAKAPLVFRLDPELHERLEQCSRRVRLKKYQLAILAMEAAVEAIEANDFRLVVPIEFRVSQVPARDTRKPTDKEVGEAVADHMLKQDIVSAVSSAAADRAAENARTLEKSADPSTYGLNEPEGSTLPVQSGQKKVSYRAAARKHSKRGRKP